MSSREYFYDPLHRRTMAIHEDDSRWRYGYNDRNELMFAQRAWPDWAPVTGQQFPYRLGAGLELDFQVADGYHSSSVYLRNSRSVHMLCAPVAANAEVPEALSLDALNRRCLARFLLTVLLVALGTLTGRPATFWVTITNQTGPGSLRQTIVDANANPGPDVIQFNLPANTRTIIPTSALPAIAESVTIDGTSQPGFAGVPLVEITGQSAGAGVHGLRITGGFSVVRGLVINRFSGHGLEISGGGTNAVEGCYIGLDVSGALGLGNGQNGILITNSACNSIGTSNTTLRNVISGNTLNGIAVAGKECFANRMVNNLIGVSADGTNDVGNSRYGIFIDDSPGNFIGAALMPNVISGNDLSGIRISYTNSIRNRVVGNHVGVDITGTRRLGNSGDGMFIGRTSENTIGGPQPDEANVISGNGGHGILFDSGLNSTISVASNRVEGNFIGTDRHGILTLGNAGHGVYCGAAAHGNWIGAHNLAYGNRIVFNGGDGVYVGALTNNLIRGNLIHANGQLGIDLGLDGVTPNDVADADSGANLLQNFPVLTAVTNSIEGTEVWGVMNSRPDTVYVIDVFVNQFCDISGHGEGQTYVGSTGVITDSAGSASFSAVFAITNLPGRMFTAVATDPQDNTSEFSRCIPAVSTLPALIYTVTNTNDSGPGSLRRAILDANENINSGDRIHFDIPGAGPHTIAPVSTLPFITDTVHIDGYTQPGATPNTLSKGFDANIKIRLDGRESTSNLEVTAGEASIRGLSIIRFNGGGIEMISNSWACRIQGNLIGLDVDGTAMGNIGSGVLVDTHSHVIGGSNPADRNVIGGHTQHGIHLGINAHNVIAQGNFVGTDPSGRFARTNQGCGFYYIGARDSLIGGTQPGAGNLISGNRVHGIEINENAARITVHGNYIGTDITGTQPLPNSRGHGVFVGRTGFTNSVGNTIGGLTAGAGNLIAFNAEDGVHIEWGTNHSIRANSIHSNGQLGIDLGMIEVGPPNDVGDGDSGANEFQNHSILPATTNEFGNAHIVGSLNSRPNRSYDIDFYANKVCDSTGRGEGETYLGSLSVTTDASGNASFSTALPLKNPDEHWITSTATDSFGNTSEFSPCVLMTPAEARLAVLIGANRFMVQWPSFVPSTFVLETTTNLSVQDSWEPVQGQIIDDGNVRSFEVIPDPSEPARFYRLRESGL